MADRVLELWAAVIVDDDGEHLAMLEDKNTGTVQLLVAHSQEHAQRGAVRVKHDTGWIVKVVRFVRAPEVN